MTEFTHFTLLADGLVVEPNEDYGTELGPCIMGMKAWATGPDQAADMIIQIGKRLGFQSLGELQVYATDPEVEAEDRPFGYDIQFTSYSDIEDEDEDDGEEAPPSIH